jgi:hypothetical protein
VLFERHATRETEGREIARQKVRQAAYIKRNFEGMHPVRRQVAKRLVRQLFGQVMRLVARHEKDRLWDR